MMLNKLKVFFQHGRQVIKDIDHATLPAIYRGRPSLSTSGLSAEDIEHIATMCPTAAIGRAPFSIDMGRCLFCGECAARWPDNITFTNEYRTASTTRQGLVVVADVPHSEFDHKTLRSVIKKRFCRAIHLRQISAGGDNSCEMELGAAGNVNFDMRRFGIEFTASPRHADGVVITGPITRNMARAVEITLAAVPDPKVIIVVGADAISGGLYAESEAIDRTFFDRHKVDLYVPGHPTHPLNFIWAVRQMIGK